MPLTSQCCSLTGTSPSFLFKAPEQASNPCKCEYELIPNLPPLINAPLSLINPFHATLPLKWGGTDFQVRPRVEFWKATFSRLCRNLVIALSNSSACLHVEHWWIWILTPKMLAFVVLGSPPWLKYFNYFNYFFR